MEKDSLFSENSPLRNSNPETLSQDELNRIMLAISHQQRKECGSLVPSLHDSQEGSDGAHNVPHQQLSLREKIQHQLKKLLAALF